MAFPVTTLLDSFKRSENPLSNEGKWTQIPVAAITAIGRCFSSTFGWVPTSAESGAYWNVTSFAEPAVNLTITPEGTTGNVSLWGCLDPATKNGYRLRGHTGTVEKWELIIEKCVGGEFSTLASAAIPGKPLAGFQIGLVVRGGVVEGWYKLSTAGEWVKLVEIADATYTTGKVGIDGTGSDTFGELNFSAATTAGGHEHTLSASQPQAVTLACAVGRNLSSTQAQVVTLLGHQGLSISQPQVAALARTPSRRLTSTQPQVAVLTHTSSRSLTTTQSQLATVTAVTASASAGLLPMVI